MNSLTPQVAVIILNWNGERLLKEYLPTVVRHTPAIGRVVVADNGSTDGSLELLRSEFPQVEVMAFDRNYGFAEGYNRAIAARTEPYCVLLNSDVEVKDDWLSALYRFMDRNEHVAACQPKIRALRAPGSFEYAGASGGFIDRNGYPYCRGRIFATVEEDRGQYDEPRTDLFWATGACLMVRTALYNRAGGLDPKFFAHMEEIDLCWRLQLMGYRIAVVPAAVVYHLGGGSLDASNPRKTYLNFRNNLLMLHKNLPETSRRAKLLRRRLLDTVAWAKFVITFDFKNAAAILRAHRDFRRMSRDYTVHPQVDLLAPNRTNILTAYYLKRRHRFSDL